MKGKKVIIIFILTLLMTYSKNVLSASTCSYEEQAKLNEAAAYIKVSYETGLKKCTTEDNWCNFNAEQFLELEDIDNPEDTELISDLHNLPYIKVIILNLTDKFYLEVVNSLTGKTRTYTTNDLVDGVISFYETDINDLSSISIDVYTSNNTGCRNEVYRTITQALPRYNTFSDEELCTEYSEHYLCEQFVGYEYVEFDKFYSIMEEYEKEQTIEKKEEPKETKEKNTENKKINNHQMYLLIGAGIVAIIILIIIIVSNKHNKKNINMKFKIILFLILSTMFMGKAVNAEEVYWMWGGKTHYAPAYYNGYRRRYCIKDTSKNDNKDCTKGEVYCLDPSGKAQYGGNVKMFKNSEKNATTCKWNYILQYKLDEYYNPSYSVYNTKSKNDITKTYMIRSAAVRIVKYGKKWGKKIKNNTGVNIQSAALALVEEAEKWCKDNNNELIYSSTTTENPPEVKIEMIAESAIDRQYNEVSGDETQIKKIYLKIDLKNFMNLEKQKREFIIQSFNKSNARLVGYSIKSPVDAENKHDENVEYYGNIGDNVFDIPELNTNCNTDAACDMTVYATIEFSTVYLQADGYKKNKCVDDFIINYKNSLNSDALVADCFHKDNGSGTQDFVGCLYEYKLEEKNSKKIENLKICSNSCKSDFEIPLECEDIDGNKVYHYKEGIVNNQENIDRCIIDNTDEKENTYKVLENDYCAIYCKEDYELTLPARKYTTSGRSINIDLNIKGKMTCYSTNIDKNKLKSNCNQNALDQINQCLNFNVPFEVNPVITYFYDEPISLNEDGTYKCETDRSTWLKQAQKLLGNGVNVFEKITNEDFESSDEYCYGDVNYNHECKGSKTNEIGLITCSNINDIPDYVNKTESTTESGIDYITPRIYYVSHPSGTVKISNDYLENSDLVEGLPIGINTPQGKYYYGINITDLGTFFDETRVDSDEGNKKDSIGRIFGTEDQNVKGSDGKTKISISKRRETKDLYDPSCHTPLPIDQNSYVCEYNVNENACTDVSGRIHYLDKECEIGKSKEECERELCGCPYCEVLCVGNCLYMIDHNKKSLRVDFRTITNQNINPNGRTLGYNWNVENPINQKIADKARNTISEIEARAANYEEVEDYDFKVILTPDKTKEIVNYNKSVSGNYADDTLTCYSYPVPTETYSKNSNSLEKDCKNAGYTWENDVCYATNIFCYSNVITDVFGKNNSKSNSGGVAEDVWETRSKSIKTAHDNESKAGSAESDENGTIKVYDYWTIYSYDSLDITGDRIPDIGISWK